MSLRALLTMATVAIVAGSTALPAAAASRHRHRHYDRELYVTRSRGLAVPVDPVVAATPNLTGRNGKTTDVNVFPDLSIGDGFPGFQTPDLYSYGTAGGGLTPYQLQ